MFSKILIANRGEIACRVMRTARRMGILTVAVYSDADARARHVLAADEAMHIGGAEARDSYLCGERIIAAAKACGAQAVHPGYGFLSENEDFAEACGKAGLVFIGPPVEAIRAMGSKSAAKALMQQAGVPLVPGYHGDRQDARSLRKEADRIGYPVLIKASAGGGGKGMRSVDKAADFAAALASCKREAAAAFGDDAVLLEKYLQRPRHIEIQVFADAHGNAIHLFERDCSVQRRHQKVIEEAPAPGMTPARRKAMGEAAVAAARAVRYVGAGTVEFIVDTPSAKGGEDGGFHFMEMNTRLQVEHPVTEMITGLDLVEWQLRVAAGEVLPLRQEEVRMRGHALEARIYAEDAQNGFLPATGRIVHMALPAESMHVRVDAGVGVGDEISSWYDPMLAKLVVWDEDRPAALARMRNALNEFRVVGPTTNVEFLGRLVGCRAFATATLDTGLIERSRDELFSPRGAPDEEIVALAALAELLHRRDVAAEIAAATSDPHSPWSCADGWRLNGGNQLLLQFSAGDHELPVTVHYGPAGWNLEFPDSWRKLGGRPLGDGRLTMSLDGKVVVATVIRRESRFDVFRSGRQYILDLHDPFDQDAEISEESGSLVAPMSGKVISVLVKPGDEVRRGTPMLIMEAMKMEHTLTAPSDGRVGVVHYVPGEQVGEGDQLLNFEASQE